MEKKDKSFDIETTEDLTKVLNSIFHNKELLVQPEEYRYKIYARKSTNDEDKQVRSLGDQVAECEEFAKEHNLKLAGKPFEESESAKEPDIRPKFRQMIDEIKAGKYDSILAWHPDRIARNMKDAGEVIDLLDKGVIKSLKFKSFTFENNPSGKMLLGITFVLSKQYSDHLSESVNRGNARSILEGKYINKSKHGYIKDDNQFLRPDGTNFLTIKNAFNKRLEGSTLDEIAEYINSQGYNRIQKKTGKRYVYKMTKQKVEKILKDPVYAGVLMYGKNEIVDLTKYYDFIPMISVKDFREINQISHNKQMIRLAKSYRKAEEVKANLMRQMVVCADCEETMSAGITPKKTNKGTVNYFYYRCETDGCLQYGKSVRAKVIMDYIYKFLEQKPFSSVTAYEHYKKEMTQVSESSILSAKSNKLSLEAENRKLEIRLERTKIVIASDEKEDIKESYRGDLSKIKTSIEANNKHIEEQKKIIDAGKATILTYSEFLELTEKIPLIMGKIKKMSELDYLIRKIFLNFTLESKKVVKSTLNTPFEALYNSVVLSGGQGETRTPNP